MKTFSLLTFGILIILGIANSKNTYSYTAEAISTNEDIKFQSVLTEKIQGKWIKFAGGQDANKNRALDDPEIIRRPEPSLYDSLDIFPDKKSRFHGMGMEFESSSYSIKKIDGKMKLLFYPKDMEPGQTQAEKDQDALKFEVILIDVKQMILIPPIYEFMIIVFKRVD